jgi:hypothetical protein
VRPQLFDPNQASLSAGLAAILAALRSYPRITRKQLAEKVLAKLLGEKNRDASSSEYGQVKTNLASDLLWLAKAGHVIEFSDGTLDLPLSPKPSEQKAPTEAVSTTPGSIESEISEEETDLSKTEHENVTEQGPAEEVSIKEPALEMPTGVEAGPGQESSDQRSGESVPNIEEAHPSATGSSAEEPITPRNEVLASEAVTTEPNPPKDSPEERREWAATGP